MPFEVDPGMHGEEELLGAGIMIVGVGGCGGNAVNGMIERNIEGVRYVVFNTDQQALRHSKAINRVKIGRETTGGLGAGADPAVGRKAAEEDRDIIAEQLKGADLVFITAGMGKGTGTGAAPVIAAIARSMGILTIGVVTRPFGFEGGITAAVADEGIAELRKHLDTLILVENEKIAASAEERASATEVYDMVNEILYQAAKSISDIITYHGHVNVDFADVRSITAGGGDALMGSAAAAGQRKALQAAMAALESPLLDGVCLTEAKGLLVNITGKVEMQDLQDAMRFIGEQVGHEAKIINGYVDQQLRENEARVTIIVTGFTHKVHNAPEGPEPPPVIPLKAPEARDLSGDLATPAYIRRNIPIDGPYATPQGSAEEQTGTPFRHTPASRSADETIRKDRSDIPAFLRRSDNPNFTGLFQTDN
ncbi:cell division protein FtsZ [Pelodictyon luteolum]|uniref:Cell division protein FtsZ n=1 Tax=Chlorobium luteolum (strain DSM 273 / BCRC 81028 / 2530) TaxID=319225 RepID=Q3B4H3_CHLL3|nr:cell division protein FtsZ [Pelodictyon luteolum]ABB23758.1 cell division protein FtsZ [Pelodictyon luteolum DSM 273]